MADDPWRRAILAWRPVIVATFVGLVMVLAFPLYREAPVVGPALAGGTAVLFGLALFEWFSRSARRPRDRRREETDA